LTVVESAKAIFEESRQNRNRLKNCFMFEDMKNNTKLIGEAGLIFTGI